MMMKSARMARVLIVGSRDWLEPAIEKLFSLGALHLIDFTEDGYFRIGAPPKGSSQLSSTMIKVRNIIKALQAEEPTGRLDVSETRKYMEGGIEELEKRLEGLEAARQKTDEELKATEKKLHEVAQFENLPLKFDDYAGYRNLAVFVGKVKALPEIGFEHELYEDREKGMIALFVPKERENEAASLLAPLLAPVAVPQQQGSPKEELETLMHKRQRLAEQLRALNAEAGRIRKGHASALYACQEELDLRIRKAELPLRLATSKNSFIVQGWVPEYSVTKLKEEMAGLSKGGLYVEKIESHGAHGNGEETPIKLENPKAARPFESMLRLFSLPSYGEIDPTLLLFITYPFFFGLMVGDLFYGLGFILLGFLIQRKTIMGVNGREPATVLKLAGLWTCLFGLFFFGEFMGIHFAPQHAIEAIQAEGAGGELYWSTMLHTDFPRHLGPLPLGIYSKFHDVTTLLKLSLIIGLVHLNLGFIIGFLNERAHGFRKAVFGKLGWLVFQLGFFMMLFSQPIENTLGFVKKIFIVEIALPGFALPAGLAIVLLAVVMLYKAEGINAILEIPAIFSNMLSYSRLIAVGLSKAGIALAVNTIGFKMLIFNGNLIGGMLVLLPFHILIFVLGIVAAGLHSLRLHYVEFFTKFFQGGGKPYDPLKIERKYTRA